MNIDRKEYDIKDPQEHVIGKAVVIVPPLGLGTNYEVHVYPPSSMDKENRIGFISVMAQPQPMTVVKVGRGDGWTAMTTVAPVAEDEAGREAVARKIATVMLAARHDEPLPLRSRSAVEAVNALGVKKPGAERG